MNKKLKVGLLGGTGLVGQHLCVLLQNHPFFEITEIAASSSSAGKTYYECVKNRWKLSSPIPEPMKGIIVKSVTEIDAIKKNVDFVFCALKMPSAELKALEESYAKAEVPVISNNSVHRFTADVPMIIPEINSQHISIIPKQQTRLGTKKGFIAAKPNCSIQSFVPAITPLLPYKPIKLSVCTYQAVSGSGKTLEDCPEIIDNVIPFIPGEEEKSELEPLKIWGSIEANRIIPAFKPVISAQCIRVPVSDGHMAAVSVLFESKPEASAMIRLWKEFKGNPEAANLPHSTKQFLTYFDDPYRPQTKLDRNLESGMGISIGRLREDSIFDYKFICLSHNAVRGAAGGSVLTAELLVKEGYL